jgi:hypothetical protein
VDDIAAVIRPRPGISDRDEPALGGLERRRPFRKLNQLFDCRLASGNLDDPLMSKLRKLDRPAFLRSLVIAAEAALGAGIQILERMGGDAWRGLSSLEHVGYRPGDPNQTTFGRLQGLAPAARLLHVTVSRLTEIDPGHAKVIVRRWAATDTGIYVRLWACLAADVRLASGNDVGVRLSELPAEVFWNRDAAYPEIIELLERRFAGITATQQIEVADRIIKLPPRSFFRYCDQPEEVRRKRIRWAVRMLQRIEGAGGVLPRRSKLWLESQVVKFPELQQLEPSARTVGTHAVSFRGDPDGRYDLLSGTERLKALEKALDVPHSAFDEGATRAENWLRLPGSPARLIDDFENSSGAAHTFLHVWGWFAWLHVPTGSEPRDRSDRDLQQQCVRVLLLLSRFPDDSLQGTIDGVAHWLWHWRARVAALPEGLAFWLRIWPIAVRATNSPSRGGQIPEHEKNASAADRQVVTREVMSNAVAKLVEVFLAACPESTGEGSPFSVSSVPATMRDVVSGVSGRAGWIVRYCLLGSLDYFLRADPAWAREKLVARLSRDHGSTAALWHAVATGASSREALGVLGQDMASIAADPQFDRSTRESLVDHIIGEALSSFYGERPPAVSVPHIQQMLRRLDDELRDHAAQEIWRVAINARETHAREQNAPPVEEVCRKAILPFLRDVWPQESSLATIGVTRSFASLPAIAGDAFEETVQAVSRFLKPFDCNSMLEYFFLDDEPLAQVDDRKKAAAFLCLLDSTIGDPRSSVVPDDLAEALAQIRKVAPQLVKDPRFRRLSAACRGR